MSITLETINKDFHSIVIDDGGGSITVDGSLTVTATDLDIRDLAFATDKVDVSGSSVELGATTLAALENISAVVTATDLDIRNLVFADDKVDVSGSSVELGATTLAALENISAVVTATDLDIRDLAFATDKVDVSGSEVSLSAGSLAALENITVSATDLDIRDLAFATDKVDVSGSSVELGATTLAALENITVSATDLDIRNLVFATDKVDVSGSSILVTPDAYSSWKVSKQTITTTESQVAATALTGRLLVQIENLGSQPVYLKNVTGVSVNDFKLSPGSLWEISLAADATIFAITGSSTADLRIAEFAG